MKFNLDDYETVDSRIKRFYEDHPDGQIVTMLESPMEKVTEFAVFKAMITFGQTSEVVASGWAMEMVGKGGPVNTTSWLENAETSAIGRGLANLGYSGNKRASREEMEKVDRMSAPADQKKEFDLTDSVEKVFDGKKVENPKMVTLITVSNAITKLPDGDEKKAYEKRMVDANHGKGTETMEDLLKELKGEG